MSELAPQYVDHLQAVSTEMVIASTRVVVDGQENRGGGDLGVSVKPDASLLSNRDPLSEAAAKGVWRERTPHPILGEETGISKGNENAASLDSDGRAVNLSKYQVPPERILGMNDPIDGTRPYINGAHTSTVMGGAYDLQEGRFVSSSVVHPTSGTLIEASNGRTQVSKLTLLPETGYEITGRRSTSTWEGPLAGSTVLVDNLAPFTRGEGENERVITDRDRLLRFHGELLEQNAVPQAYGSNGYHQLLLAQGGEKLAGAIMVSQGGPWDALGWPAVENAGGHARAFVVQENGSIEERDPHDPFNWDILVLGSTAVNADKLAGVIERTFAA